MRLYHAAKNDGRPGPLEHARPCFTASAESAIQYLEGEAGTLYEFEISLTSVTGLNNRPVGPYPGDDTDQIPRSGWIAYHDARSSYCTGIFHITFRACNEGAKSALRPIGQARIAAGTLAEPCQDSEFFYTHIGELLRQIGIASGPGSDAPGQWDGQASPGEAIDRRSGRANARQSR